ncbi:MAG: hypothetical protein IPF55_11590 [Rhodoferax sp.]|nr:hypothetical protein [Rhodoferax sp.]
MKDADKITSLQAVVSLYYNAKNYAKAIEWIDRYLQAGGTEPMMGNLRPELLPQGRLPGRGQGAGAGSWQGHGGGQGAHRGAAQVAGRRATARQGRSRQHAHGGDTGAPLSEQGQLGHAGSAAVGQTVTGGAFAA